MNKKIKCLITGVTGMVGSHLADYLIKFTDWKIIGVCRWRSPQDNVAHLSQDNKRIKFDYADLLDQNSIDRVLSKYKPDYIFHLAAQSFPTTSFYMVTNTFDTNILGTARLLESVKKFNLNPIIHICSSSEIFGKVSKNEIPIDENCRFHPASPYAISKVGTDLLGSYYHEAYNLKTLTTRMFTHTGPRRGEVFAESAFAKQIVEIEKGYSPPIIRVGNLNSLRTFADVRDAVRAYFLLVTKSKKFGETYNIGGNFSCKIGDMLNSLLKLSNLDFNKIQIKVDKNLLRPIDADLQVPNTRKFEKNFKWKPEISFEKTMIDLLDYWREKI